MNFRTQQVALAAASIASASGILAPQTSAAPSKVKAGRATLTLTAKSTKALKRHHVKLTAGKPGSAKGRSYRLPLRGGSYDFRSNRGTVTQAGSLRLKRGRRSVRITAIRVTLAKNSKIVAKVAGKRLTLAVLSRRSQRVKSSGTNRSVGNVTVRFSAKAAKRLNTKLGRRVFTGRTRIASLSVLVRRPRAAGSGAKGTKQPPTSVAKLGVAPGVSKALADNGATVSALPGSKRLPDGSVSLPVTAVSVDSHTGSGTVRLAGGLALGSGSNTVTLDQPQVVLGGSEQGFYAVVNGVRVKLADLDRSGLSDALASGTKQFSDLLALLTPEGAATLNQAGGASLFVPGTPLGDLSLSLPPS